jgi:hypothetical protein
MFAASIPMSGDESIKVEKILAENGPYAVFFGYEYDAIRVDFTARIVAGWENQPAILAGKPRGSRGGWQMTTLPLSISSTI